MVLKIVRDYDPSFTLTRESETVLFDLLSNGAFIEHISRQLQGIKLEFTDLIFQPVPYSQNTPKGMPAAFEPYYNCDRHVIINVPPNIMFQAKIFQPNRLCAIYRRLDVASEE
jgi:hypothetical protein